SEARRAAYGLLEAKRDGDAAGMEEKVGEYRRHVSRAMETRRQARELRGGAGEVNYAFPHFILNFMPVGVVGLLLAAIFAAALSSIDSELNAMATVTALDLYRFGLRRDPGDRGLLLVSRLATVIWGALATVFALHAGQLGSVIEAVNQVGSYFYGSLLGVFVLALAVPRANGHGAFFGLLAGMAAVAAAGLTEIAFLYQNVLGTGVVLLVGTLVSRFHRGGRASRAAVASL
ncbi:MAG: hypothetical protein ACE5GW_10805, partial [Planctomycetota bacterium]